MSKLVIIIALIAAFLIIKHLIDNRSRSKTTEDNAINEEHNHNDRSEALGYKQTVQCGYCGAHIPTTLAFKSGDKTFCDETHCKHANDN